MEQNIEADDATFDVVFLLMGPMIMPDPSRVFAEIQRVLVVGGWSGYLTPNHMEAHDYMIEARKETLEASNRAAEFRSFYNSDMMQKWGTADALKARLQDARFEQVESLTVHCVTTMQRGVQLDEMVSIL